MKSHDYAKCLEISENAVKHLIDLQSGYFERLNLASKELFSLKRDDLCDDILIEKFFDISSMFDQNNIDHSSDFCHKNLSDMDLNTQVKLSQKILDFYSTVLKCFLNHQTKIKLFEITKDMLDKI